MKTLRFQYIGDGIGHDYVRYEHKVDEAKAGEIIGKLRDPDAVITIDSGSYTTYIPVRAVAQLRVENSYGD